MLRIWKITADAKIRTLITDDARIRKQLTGNNKNSGKSGSCGSCGSSLVAIPDCKPEVPSLNLAISPVSVDCQSFDGMLTYFTVGCPLRGGGGVQKQKGLLGHQRQLQ
jgi:hypothetical protein